MAKSYEGQIYIDQWNSTKTPFPSDMSICDLIRDAAERNPDNPAIVDHRGVVYTHRQLQASVNRISHLLLSLNLSKGKRVAFIGKRSSSAIPWLIGIMQSGASYVPLDTRWPRSRLLEILKPLKITCLIHDNWAQKLVYELAWDVPAVSHIISIDDTDIFSRFSPEQTIELWDYVAAKKNPTEAAGFNLRDEASVDKLQIEMYQQHIAKLIHCYSQSDSDYSLLDIGCGIGYGRERIIERCQNYVGVDPSQLALNRLQRISSQWNDKVFTFKLFAHEINRVGDQKFDVILLASVTQFFPNALYFEHVVKLALSKLTPNGRIIIADVLNPNSGQQASLLRISPAHLTHFISDLPGDIYAHILSREQSGFEGVLSQRYDCIIRAQECPDPAVKKRQRLTHSALIGMANTAPPVKIDPTDDAYVLFTSGSTGVPKGVLVKHRSVVNLIDWVNKKYQIGPTKRLLMVTAFCFDLSVYDMFGILAAGASLYVAPDRENFDPDEIAAILEKQDINFWDSAPATLSALIPSLKARNSFRKPGEFLFFLSGDWIPLNMPEQILGFFPEAQVVALGGATEATIWSNHYEISKLNRTWKSIPYGKPIQNARYYVLDKDLQHKRLGEEGDLYIAGPCLSAGYVNNIELTKKRYLRDPYAEDTDERMYFTGDKAKWLADGNMEFLGRSDHQVKLHGFRIELGEIQNTLTQHVGVQSCAVIMVGTGLDQQLIAFLCGPQELDTQILLQFARNKLPLYAVPTQIRWLADMPLSSTGKIDRDELSKLATNELPPPHCHSVPVYQTSLRFTLEHLWCEILSRKSISLEDDFFELGGQSIAAARMSAWIQEEFSVDFPVRNVFDYPQFDEMLEQLNRAMNDAREKHDTE